jgi:cytochrome c oxidase subunit II
VVLCGCSGVQSALDPKGPAAALIAQSHWVMAGGATFILVLVVAIALYAVYRDPERRSAVSSRKIIFFGGVLFPVVVLSALLAYGVLLMARLSPGASANDDLLEIEIVARQWWWEVRYPAAIAGETTVSANELHIPAGRPVMVHLRSVDVIHSFWIPSLAGKLDVIPGKERRLRLQADAAGVFRGQCAEFCGAQHARMGLLVKAEAPEEFQARLARMRLPRPERAAPVVEQGRTAFRVHECGTCHTVRDHFEEAASAPDLTHLADRAWLGAGAMPNTPRNVATWIARSQRFKPGNAMPSYEHLDEATLTALAAFLWGEP